MLSYLFSTGERVKILEEVLYEKDLTITGISNETGVNKGLISRYVNSLTEFGILSKNGRFVSYVDSSFTRQIKVLLNLSRLRSLDLDNEIITGLGLFGSWAEGTNTVHSDIDVWVFLKKEDNELIGKMIQIISKLSGTEPDILVLSPNRWDNIKKDDLPLYHRLMRINITLIGEDLEGIR